MNNKLHTDIHIHTHTNCFVSWAPISSLTAGTNHRAEFWKLCEYSDWHVHQ